MKRILITGMSGTGKSAVIVELLRRGYRAIDLDTREWSRWIAAPPDDDLTPRDGQDWVWREDRVRELLSRNDDQPYLFEIGNPPLVSLPYSVQTTDVPAYFEMKVSVPEFEAMLKRQFDTLYREGETIPRVMAIAVHPFVTGQPHRIGALDAALEYICSHAGVWRATGWEIVQHFLAQQPERAATAGL